MKLIVKTDKEINSLKPRDIRNFIGKIADESYKDDIFWHKHLPPKLIYVKPFRLGFEIVNYDNSLNLLNHIAKRLEKFKNRVINLKGIETKIKKVWFKPEEFIIPQKGLYFYKTRTPVRLSNNPVEYKIVYACNNKSDRRDLIRYITHRIKSDIEYKAKHYFNIDLDLSDLNLIIQDENVRLVEYKKGLKDFQAVYMTFASNYSLPRFVGYGTGLGWGELIMQKMWVSNLNGLENRGE